MLGAREGALHAIKGATEKGIPNKQHVEPRFGTEEVRCGPRCGRNSDRFCFQGVEKGREAARFGYALRAIWNRTQHASNTSLIVPSNTSLVLVRRRRRSGGGGAFAAAAGAQTASSEGWAIEKTQSVRQNNSTNSLSVTFGGALSRKRRRHALPPFKNLIFCLDHLCEEAAASASHNNHDRTTHQFSSFSRAAHCPPLSFFAISFAVCARPLLLPPRQQRMSHRHDDEAVGADIDPSPDQGGFAAALLQTPGTAEAWETQSDFQLLKQALLNERCAPDVLQYETELVARAGEALSRQEAVIDDLEQLPDADLHRQVRAGLRGLICGGQSSQARAAAPRRRRRPLTAAADRARACGMRARAATRTRDTTSHTTTHEQTHCRCSRSSATACAGC